MRHCKTWSVAETRDLRRMWEAGESDEAIAAAFGRTPCSVKKKRGQHGMTVGRAVVMVREDKRRNWTDSMIAILREMNAAGYTDSEVAEAVGKTKFGVARMRQRLSLKKNVRRPTPPLGSGNSFEFYERPSVRPCPLTLRPGDHAEIAAMTAALRAKEGVEGAMLAVMRLRGLAA